MPRSYTDICYGTSDGFIRTIRYKASSDADWSNVDLSAATGVDVYLINAEGTVAIEFDAVSADSALFDLGATGTLTFTAAADTFTSSDVGNYNLWVKVTNTDWAAGVVFRSPVGIRIGNVDVS